MKTAVNIILSIATVFVFSGNAQAKNKLNPGSQNLFFIENKGQVKDQFGNSRNDIQYVLQSAGLSVFIGNGQLHYQFSKREPGCAPQDRSQTATQAYPFSRSTGKETRQQDLAEIAYSLSADIATYRMDVELAGANKEPEMIMEQPLAYYENYYYSGSMASGITARTCNRITYKNVYPGIDWVIYIKDNKLEHEFVIGPGADASQIKLKYNGQTSLKINEDGSITATTPMGTIREHAPVCYRTNGNIEPSSFRLHKNVLSYQGDLSGALVIDPILEWGTYYGADSETTYFYGVGCDDSSNVYAGGLTYGGPIGTIVTSGAYDVTLTGGGTAGFLVKFDSSGHRIWSTYFGADSVSENLVTAVGCDKNGYVYIGGQTGSLTGISTPGAPVPTYSGGSEWAAYLEKFTSAGTRVWGTYIGGDSNHIHSYDAEVNSICFDTLGHVFASGQCDDTSYVTTCCSFKPKKYYGADTNETFLIQYDTSGAEIWGTYYGEWWHDFVGGMCSDGSNVYLSGYTYGGGVGRAPIGSDIPTAGCWQPVFGGGLSDAFLVKFDNSGARQWGTYYGGPSDEQTGAVACDKLGNVYLFGTSSSDTGITTPGTYQPARAGGQDAFLAKFNGATGMRIWGTYYGGPGDESVALSPNISIDSSGSVYIHGYTSSTSGIATPCASQPTYGGGANDAFFAKFDSTGKHCWGTYYGGNGNDNAINSTFDGQDVYICGSTGSSDNIATPGAFLSVAGTGPIGYFQGFLTKFNTCNCPIPITGIDSVCFDSVITLSDSLAGGVWSSSNTTIATVDSIGLVKAKTVGVVTIQYSVYNACAISEKQIYVTNKCNEGVKNLPLPSGEIIVFPNPTEDNITITATGAINKVEISNLLGQIVFSGAYTTGNVTISLAQLPAGVYFVKVNDTNVYKVTKQ